MSTDLQHLLRWAEGVGWTVEHRGSGHLALHYGTETVILPLTPSDSRSLLNARADLERACGQRQHRPNAPHYRSPSPDPDAFNLEAVVEDRQTAARRQAADDQRRPVPAGVRQLAAKMKEKSDGR